MKILMLWSGGLDSTYLLTKLLADGNEVTPLYVHLISPKADREMAAVDKMWNILKTQYPRQLNDVIIHQGPNITINYNPILAQPPIWLFGAMMYQSHFDEVHIAYVMGDCAISFLDEIQSVWQSFSWMFPHHFAKLQFPLTKIDKLQEWRHLNDDIRNLITWCEGTQTADNCGECVPCRKMKFYQLFPSDNSRCIEKQFSLLDNTVFNMRY